MSSSEFSEVEFVPRDAKVFDDVGDDAARHVAGMPRECDEAVGAERIGVVPMTAGVAQVFTADFAQAALQLATVEGGVFTHRSGGEDEFVAEGGRDGASGFQQRFQMGFCGLLKTKNSFTPVASVGVTAR